MTTMTYRKKNTCQKKVEFQNNLLLNDEIKK